MSEEKHVLWDEKNLEENEEYRRAHPVLMRITEPKTPFERAEYDEEGNFIDGPREEKATAETWDPEVNALARKVREELEKEICLPAAPINSSGRPMLPAAVTNGELLKEQHDTEFKTMRRAVYADEGAKFKALLAQKDLDDEDDTDETGEAGRSK